MKNRKPENSYTETHKSLFPWLPLTSEQQIDIIINESENQPIAIFKHSTRCMTSKRVLSLFEESWDFENNPNITFYYLDLLAHRNISNKIADCLNVEHQSPQLIVIHKGKVIYHDSHSHISAEEVAKKITAEY